MCRRKLLLPGQVALVTGGGGGGGGGSGRGWGGVVSHEIWRK